MFQHYRRMAPSRVGRSAADAAYALVFATDGRFAFRALVFPLRLWQLRLLPLRLLPLASAPPPASLAWRSRSALVITDAELRLMAKAATMGESSPDGWAGIWLGG